MGTFSKTASVFLVLWSLIAGMFSTGKNTVYYFDSVNGSDTNLGTSENAPLKSLSLLNQIRLKSGDTVLIKADSVYRNKLYCRKGVTYGSYGEGKMPTIMPSVDASDASQWVNTDTSIWKFKKIFLTDAGNIIFNDGEKVGIKIAKDIKGYEGKVDELKNDLEFVHASNGYVYVFSEQNPAERFDRIEIARRTHGIELKSGVTVDGLRVLYAGCHGMDGSELKNVTIRNCEVGYCGGALHYEGSRYGNGIQFWLGGDNLTVENCYVYQIYDAGLTFQSSEGVFTNVKFINNRVNKCTYAIEYFNNGDGYFKNILLDSNMLTNSGYGWGAQRPDPVHTSAINSWYSHGNRAENFVISNNTLQCSTHALFNIGSLDGTPPTFRGNTYRQPHSGYMFSNHTKFYSDEAKELMREMDPTGSMKYYYGTIE
ncbi:MAG TPA: hypothetical protein DDY98_09325 [Ruminococcaceae bacterium]|nr:hypothetical protein [Oscillospiraceae bacterium]